MDQALLRLDQFEPSRTAGLERLKAFVPYAGQHYAKHRNTDYGPSGPVGVSGLSPYLRYRLITEAEVIGAVLAEHSLQTAEKFIQEVVWRTYWKGWLQMRPSVWADYRLQLHRDFEALEHSSTQKKCYQSAISGTAGIDGFDDWAKTLIETGYLHNHARMWFASIWIFTLGLPWTLGADFFLKHLIDADPASNTLSWRWVAGIQTPGKTYLATADNIERFSQGRYRPKGLAHEALPVPANPAPKPTPLLDRPTPGEALDKPSMLLTHPEDLSLGVMLRSHPMVRRVVWVRQHSGHEPWPWAKHSRSFVEQAIDQLVKADDRVQVVPDARGLAALANEVGALQIVTTEAPTGPMSDAIDGLKQTLTTPLVLARTHYDSLLWPLATRGFFPFKKDVLTKPSLMQAIAEIPTS